MNCQYDNCSNISTYGLSFGNVTHCKNHKLDGLKLVSQFCKTIGCNKRPGFNYENSKGKLYCFEHKKDGMVSKDNRKCLEENCTLRPTYNHKGEDKAIYCSNHKLENMVNIVNKKCEFEGCNVRPSFNFENEVGCRFCFNHKQEGMISKDNRKCISNLCFGTRGNKNYDGYCTHCFQNLFPNNPLTLQIYKKSKELKVRDYLFQEFEGFIHDKPLWTGNCDCTHRRRIDFRKLIGNTLLCIEVDENQHKGYNNSDEELRYDDLYMLHSGKFIFIRFNPDKFKFEGKTYNPIINTRLVRLKDKIERQFFRIENELNNDLIEIIKLYYDY